MKKVNLVIILTILMLTSCVQPPKSQSKQNESTLSQIPSIVKALELLANTGKKKVDKDE